MYLDENYDLKGISDPDGDNYKELLLYENGYIVSTDENSFLACQLKAAPAGEGTNNGSNYARRVTHLLTLEGELVTDIAFDTISTYEDHILAKAGDITYVLDGTTGEVIRELTGNIVRFFEDSGVFVVSKDDDEKRSGTSYGLMDIDMNVLTEGWDGYSNLYKGGTDDYFTFYNYVDNTYVTDTYIVSKEGKVVFGPFAEKDTWIFIMNDDKFITERYDTVNYNPIYEMYDYEGNSLEFDKDYVSIQRQYNFNGVKDYIIAAYDNPVSAGYLYDVLDMDLNVLYSGFNYIYPYGNGGRVASVSKGFDIGLFDLETGEWVYSERSFNSLDD